ncbi:hypothetical protein CLJ1_2780 [Pseudomonas paraeruginosa]|nr:hypothetical protein CSC28_2900 [Pseudomonas paraeruginosa]PTC36755.1 hypothetical protein CLJ1_2780 [Pseudomonas aeruginosa]
MIVNYEEITNLTFIREYSLGWQMAAVNDGEKQLFGAPAGWPRQCCSRALKTKFF